MTEPTRIDRRTFMRRGAMGTGALWALSLQELMARRPYGSVAAASPLALFLVTALMFRVLPSLETQSGPGRTLERVALIELPLQMQQRDEQRARQTIGQLLQHLRQARGLESVAAASLWGSYAQMTTVEQGFNGRTPGEDVMLSVASPDVCRVLDLPVTPVLEGLFISLGAAAVIRMWIQSYFTRPVSAIDPVAFGIAMVPLLIAGAVACYIPARRASSVDPNTALRHL